jgi:hypothetical protein
MKFSRQLVFALGLSLIFLIIHILIVFLKPSEHAVLFSTLTIMAAMQVFAYLILKRNFKGRSIKFIDIFLLLGLTMSISVILLALNSAYNPYVERKPLNFSEILISLLIFSGIFTVTVTSIIWFVFVNRRKPRS